MNTIYRVAGILSAIGLALIATACSGGRFG